jgi:diguanylate cyclase (GGDEF)-like protein/PAS domain S-box-containing protein
MLTSLGVHYFQKLFAEIQEAIVVVSDQGMVLDVNREFCRLFGYGADEAIGRGIDDLVAPDAEHSAAANITRAVAQGESLAMDVVRRRKSGALVHVSLLALPVVTESRETLVFAVYRDISERKLAEQTVAESRRQLEEANRQLENLSNLDGLTAIPNRRQFEAFYPMEWRRRCREGKPIALIMVDIDYFKRYNDHYGHLAGDRCLKLVAQALQVVNRAGDLVARYGGEEFVAVLSGTALADAQLLAERMRQRVKDLAIVHEHSTVAHHVTISLGVAAEVPIHRGEAMALLAKADQALYLAKKRGRDRVVLAED